MQLEQGQSVLLTSRLFSTSTLKLPTDFEWQEYSSNVSKFFYPEFAVVGYRAASAVGGLGGWALDFLVLVRGNRANHQVWAQDNLASHLAWAQDNPVNRWAWARAHPEDM